MCSLTLKPFSGFPSHWNKNPNSLPWATGPQMIWPLHLSNFTMATHPSAHHAVTHQYVYFLKLSKFFPFYLLLSLTKASHSPHRALRLVPHYSHLSLHLCLQNYHCVPCLKFILIISWGQEKGTTENEMVGWHHWLDGHEFEQTPGDSENREAWRAAVHGVAKSQTRLSDWTTTNHLQYFLFPSLIQKYFSSILYVWSTGRYISEQNRKMKIPAFSRDSSGGEWWKQNTQIQYVNRGLPRWLSG